MKTLLFLILLTLTIPVNALDFKITIEDQDAIDAMNYEIDRIKNAGTEFTPEQYLSDFLTRQHSGMRENQLRTTAQAKANNDPDLVAFLKAKADKAAVAADQLQTTPPIRITPQ